jgi:hypothetical protein
MGALGVGRDDRCVAEVEDPELLEGIDAGLQVPPGCTAGGADRPRPAGSCVYGAPPTLSGPA